MEILSRSNSFCKEDKSSNGNCRQVLTALAICYICISGGNLVGYTSSAIPSIREGSSIPFLKQLDDELKSHKALNVTVAEIAFRIQDQALDEIGSSSRNEKDETSINKEFVELTDTQASWIGGLAPLGAFFGCLLAPFIIKALGPKGSIAKVGAPAYLMSWFATALAPSLVYIYVARIIGGLALGLTFSCIPIYIMDTSSLEMRGPLGTLSQFLFTIGVLASFIFGYFFSWRTSALISGLIVLPVFIILLFVPESEAWLIRSKNGDKKFKMKHISWDVNSNSNGNRENCQNSLLRNGFLNSPTKVKSTFVAMFLAIFQQLTGINAVNFYTVTIFETAAGPDSLLDGHSSAIIVASVFCLTNVLSYILVEKLGRKILLIISTALISIATFSLGGYFYMLEIGHDVRSFSMIPLASLVTFVLAFSIGYGPLLYVIVAEILPDEIRSTVSPIVVGVNWLSVFLVAKTFPGIIHSLKAYGAFWLYGTFSCVSLLFTIFYVPETKGRTDKEIQAFFSNRSKGPKCENLLETETQI